MHQWIKTRDNRKGQQCQNIQICERRHWCELCIDRMQIRRDSSTDGSYITYAYTQYYGITLLPVSLFPQIEELYCAWHLENMPLIMGNSNWCLLMCSGVWLKYPKSHCQTFFLLNQHQRLTFCSNYSNTESLKRQQADSSILWHASYAMSCITGN